MKCSCKERAHSAHAPRAERRTHLVEIPEEQRALLADALHLCEVVVLQSTRAVRPEDEALQQLDRYVQSHEADSTSCRNKMEAIKWTCGGGN